VILANTNKQQTAITTKTTKTTNMNKQQIAKFRTLVKRNTQSDAVAECLNRGEEFSVEDAKMAGIGDPRRVVNRLRTERGVKIYSNSHRLRGGTTVKRYTLVSPKAKR